MSDLFYSRRRARFLVGEGTEGTEGTEGGDDAAAAAAAAAAAEAARKAKPKETFLTQQQVNALLATERRKAEDKARQLESQLAAIQQAGLSPEDRERLEATIVEVRNQFETKEELAKAEAKSQLEKLQREAENNKATAELWKQRFLDNMVDTAITTAAVQAEVLPEALPIAKTWLKSRVLLAEARGDDGKPNGTYDIKIKVDTPDKEKGTGTKTLEASVVDAFKLMKEQKDQFGFMFSGTGRSGLGAAGGVGGGGQTGEVDVRKLSPAEYMALRDKDPKRLGLNRQPKKG